METITLTIASADPQQIARMLDTLRATEGARVQVAESRDLPANVTPLRAAGGQA